MQFDGKDVVGVSFFGSKVADADLAQLATLPTVRVLDFSGTAVSDAGLAELSRRVTAASRTTPPTPTTQGPLKVGAVLDGWRLELLLGRGGWGQVFKATRNGEERALKVMHPELSRDPLFVERFTAEILTLASLRGDEDRGRRGNEYVVKIHNFGSAVDAAYERAVADCPVRPTFTVSTV